MTLLIEMTIKKMIIYFDTLKQTITFYFSEANQKIVQHYQLNLKANSGRVYQEQSIRIKWENNDRLSSFLNKSLIITQQYSQSIVIKSSYFIATNMDYDARKDSLQSQQESEKVEIYITAHKISAEIITAEVALQEANKPRKNIYASKPTHVNNSKAQFGSSVTIQYLFQVRQKLTIDLFDVTGSGKTFLGRVQSTVGEIFNGRNKGILKPIESQGLSRGQLILKCDKIDRGTNKYVQFDLVSRNVDVGHSFLCFGEGDCQWKLYKVKNNQQYLLYQSETRAGSNNRFNHMRINQKRLCNNNPKQPIILRFFDGYGKNFIGESRFDLSVLTQGNLRFTLMNRNSEKGNFYLQNFKQSIKYDFTDFLSSGMQMAMVVCIDFTASNGIQTSPTSLHYHTAAKKSQYEEALHQVCNIVLDYDTDKLVPTFGFGAKVNLPNFSSYGKVHHCFPINGSETNPNVFQLAGIMQAYRNCLPYLQFSGPTYFAPLLRQAMQVCKQMKQGQKQYMILLILTDGVIHDKDEVKDLLVKCGRLPLSVIIIGIGNGDDWSAMQQLDDDECQMTDLQGNKTERDLVQFVVFAEHNNNGVQLAQQVLQELPRQVEEYHQLCKLTPDVYKKNLMSDILVQRQKII